MKFLLSLLAGGVVAAGSLSAAPPTTRFHGTVRGAITIAGNTLGLSKGRGENGPGTADGIGTFTSVDTSRVDDVPPNPSNPWFPGTTSDYLSNSSAAPLRLPVGADVLHAELVWSGSYQYGAEDVSQVLDSAVRLTAESGAAIAATPDAVTATTISALSAGGAAYRYYVRSTNVTSFVRAHGGGTYTVWGVPATQDQNIDSLQAAGWALVVAYADPAEAVRTLTIAVDGRVVDGDSAADISFEVDTPLAGALDGRLLLAALEGDANLVGDGVLISSGGGAGFVPLSTVNNPVDNFFASQINDPSGALDTAGTFGDRNHDSQGVQNLNGARQGWDVTGVGLAQSRGEIANGQTTALVRLATKGDAYVVTATALETTAVETAAVCGNGALEEGEECDDGNLADGDGCQSTCRFPPSAGLCGDGVVDPGEECDDGNVVDGDGCESTCRFTPSPPCGNGVVDPGEECDAGVQNGFPLCSCETDCRLPSIQTACGVIDDYRRRLASCEAEMHLTDADQDGEPDVVDRCPGTPIGSAVDDSGCSLAQFCGGFDIRTARGALRCQLADWRNDEPIMPHERRDCRVEWRHHVCVPATRK